MEICFKSSIFEKGELIKSFDKDFKSQEIDENTWFVNNGSVQGTIQDVQLNKMYIFYQNFKATTNNFDLVATHDFPLFKLHFEFDGDVAASFENNNKASFKVLKEQYNLFYFPASTVTYEYHEDQKKSLEIYFTESLLQNVMGLCFTGKSKNLQDSKLNQTVCGFFKEGMLMNEQVGGILKDVINCGFEGVMKKAFLEAKIIELLLISLTVTKEKVVEDDLSELDRENLKVVEKHIKTNLKGELTISELSLLAGMNTSKLKKCFKQLYGTTIFKYITSLRIEKAKELIQKEKFTISQASYEVGYKNPQHFTVAFKKKLGYLPSQLKKYTYQMFYLVCLNDIDICLFLEAL
ncbi:AraC family transcriptional regulator [Wenyingzhuangia sp. 1_MG-2023]|nr:AraC family transcriptional regulator [Wenyingzhuangia sp. 1_MG-2023]